MADEQYVDLTDDELAAWRARFGRTDRPRVVTGKAVSRVVSSTGQIRVASDDPEPA